ncbi:hypothetical protein, partial [Mesotoga sp. UBA5847]|uniref:hypothetical protein n=1 Tax=Mesotoga sp. UBA5847 TaxID=1946859 RepID=UPI0025FE20C0
FTEKAAARLKAENPLIAAKDNVEPSKASPRSGHCDLGRSCPALRLMFYSSITSSRQRTSLPAEGGNASCLCDCFATTTLFLVF